MWESRNLLLVLFLVCSGSSNSQENPTDEFTITDYRNAIWQAYDETISFDDNVYALLGDLCPESVYCPSELVAKNDGKVDNLNGSNALFHRTSRTREIIRNNTHRLSGCCLPCSCERDCVEKQNCCPTAISYSGVELYGNQQKENPVIQECVLASIKSYKTGKLTAFRQAAYDEAYYMVTKCFSAIISDEVSIKCTNPDVMNLDETTPVFSQAHGKIYKNRFCAECNNATVVVPWIPHVIFNRLVPFAEWPSTQNNFYELAVNSNGKSLDLVYLPPDEMLSMTKDFSCEAHILIKDPNCEEVLGEMKLAGEEQTAFFQRSCEMNNVQPYKLYNGFFSNALCFFCQKSTPNLKLSCDASSREVFENSFNALLAVTSEAPRRPAKVPDETSTCRCTKYFDHRKNKCRQLFCAPGWGFSEGCVCRNYLTRITGMSVRLYLELFPEVNGDAFMQRFGGPVSGLDAYRLSFAIKKAILALWGSLDIKPLVLYRENSTSAQPLPKFYAVHLLTFKGKKDNRVRIRKVLETLDRANTAIQILDTPMAIRLGQIREITKGDGNLEMVFNGPMNRLDEATPIRLTAAKQDHRDRLDLGEVVSKLAYCERIQLDAEEIDLMRHNASVLGFSDARVSYIFNEIDGSICVDEFERAAYFSPSAASRVSDTSTAAILVMLLFVLNLQRF